MIMELPKNFSPNMAERRYAFIRNGILYLYARGIIDFEDLVYDLTYSKKGKSKCYFCLKNVPEGKITLDHIFPKSYGGISITNNLLPSCQKCNSQKGSLNHQEYFIFRRIKGKNEKDAFRKIIFEKNERIRYSTGFILPESWVDYVAPEDITLRTYIDDYQGGQKYKRYIDFINTYNQLPKPIIVSSNNVLLDGYVTFMAALDSNFTKIPIVKLDNVVVL